MGGIEQLMTVAVEPLGNPPTANWSSVFSLFREVGGWEPKISHCELPIPTFVVDVAAAGQTVFMGVILDESPADCNEIPDEIFEGRSPHCWLTHLSEPMLVVRLAGPLHLCRRLSHQVGGGAGALVS